MGAERQQDSDAQALTVKRVGSEGNNPVTQLAQLRQCSCQTDWRDPASNPTGTVGVFTPRAKSLKIAKRAGSKPDDHPCVRAEQALTAHPQRALRSPC